jgi:Tol biopolymer transport system component
VLTTSMPSRLVLSVVMTLAVVGAQDMLTTRRIDLTLSEGTSMAAAVSPDRRSIAIDLLGNIWVLPIRGGEAKRITPELLEARQPTWSPDSQSIAFQGYEDGAWHIYIVNREGGDPRPVTQGEFDDREPAWSHDGSRIAFSTDRADGISTIWEIALATGALRRVTTRTAWMPAWAPNDEFLMFFSANQEVRPDGVPFTGLWMIGAAGGEPQMISGNATLVAAAISPDGRRVASTTANGHLVVD